MLSNNNADKISVFITHFTAFAIHLITIHQKALGLENNSHAELKFKSYVRSGEITKSIVIMDDVNNAERKKILKRQQSWLDMKLYKNNSLVHHCHGDDCYKTCCESKWKSLYTHVATIHSSFSSRNVFIDSHESIQRIFLRLW